MVPIRAPTLSSRGGLASLGRRFRATDKYYIDVKTLYKSILTDVYHVVVENEMFRVTKITIHHVTKHHNQRKEGKILHSLFSNVIVIILHCTVRYTLYSSLSLYQYCVCHKRNTYCCTVVQYTSIRQ